MPSERLASRRVNLRQQRTDTAAARHDHIRREFGKRQQHERTLVQMRVRHVQPRLVDDLIAAGEDVEVEYARAPARRIALTAGLALDCKQRIEQATRRKLRLQFGYCIDEFG